jgi:hypothetical protein
MPSIARTWRPGTDEYPDHGAWGGDTATLTSLINQWEEFLASFQSTGQQLLTTKTESPCSNHNLK